MNEYVKTITNGLLSKIEKESIEDRTHWTELVEKTIFDGELTFDDFPEGEYGWHRFHADEFLKAGVEYTVFFDGDEYKCVATMNSDGIVYIGNEIQLMSNTDTMPFGINSYMHLTDYTNSVTEIFVSSPGVHTLSISYKDEIIHKLDEKYLPDMESIKNIEDGSGHGSIRTINSAIENTDYKMGDSAFAEGIGSMAFGTSSHAEGYYTKATELGSHAEGCETISENQGSHAEGSYTSASAYSSHAEGDYTTAEGSSSHAEGSQTTASGDYSHAEGIGTEASGFSSHAEGSNNTASGKFSHVEGGFNTASGEESHAEGSGTTASGDHSHAEGQSTTASGISSHAEGQGSVAKGGRSHAEGHYTTASSDYQHVQGKFNIEDTENKYAHIVGNGTNSVKSNAHTLDWDGNAWFQGTIKLGGTSQDDTNAKTLATEEYVNQKAYTHPTHTAKSNGFYKVTVDDNGHVTGTAPVTKDDVINLGISGEDTVYTLPAAGSDLGGVKTGGDVTITNGIITVNDDSHNHVISNIDGLQTALDGKENSGAAASALANANSYTDTKIANLINGAPTTLDTLGEIATAMANNSSVVQALEGAIGNKSDSNHTHNYAGSSSVGGAATSANKLNTNAGSATQPVYFENGVPVKTTYTLGKSVPSDAKFTDTVYTHPSYTAKTSGLYKVTVDNTGHVSATAAVTKDDITALGIPAQDTQLSYGTNTPAANGTASAGTAATVSRSDHIHPLQTTVSGNAGSATKLATARTIHTNLGSTSAASFDGTGNVTPGITGTLGITNGGTGATTGPNAVKNLGGMYASVKATLPAGILYGDIDQDGAITDKDISTLLNHVVKASIITDPTKLALADVNGDGAVNMDDISILQNMVPELNKSNFNTTYVVPYIKDYTGNWKYNSNYATTGTSLYYDITVPNMTATCNVTATIEGTFPKNNFWLEPMAGKLRVHAILCPLDKSYDILITFSEGTGKCMVFHREKINLHDTEVLSEKPVSLAKNNIMMYMSEMKNLSWVETDFATNITILSEFMDAHTGYEMWEWRYPMANTFGIVKTAHAKVLEDLGIPLSGYLDMEVKKFNTSYVRVTLYPQVSKWRHMVFYCSVNVADNVCTKFAMSSTTNINAYNLDDLELPFDASDVLANFTSILNVLPTRVIATGPYSSSTNMATSILAKIKTDTGHALTSALEVECSKISANVMHINVYPKLQNVSSTYGDYACSRTYNCTLAIATDGTSSTLTPFQCVSGGGSRFTNYADGYYTKDCNDLSDGFWKVSSSATNGPGYNANIIHKTYDDTFTTQMALCNDKSVYVRFKTDGSWSRWGEVYVTGL